MVEQRLRRGVAYGLGRVLSGIAIPAILVGTALM
jgi:hypothetical protein